MRNQQPGTTQKIVSYGAFADDLTLVAEDRESLQKLADICRSFFELHDIEVNCNKTIHTAKDPLGNSVAEDLPKIRLADGAAGQVQVVVPPTIPFRLLGCWLSLDGKSKEPLRIIRKTVKGLCNIIKRKEISHEIAIYIINAVIIPAITHKAATLPLSDSQCDELDRSWLTLIKRKAHMARSMPNALLWAPQGFNLTNVRDAMDSSQIADLLRRLDSPGMLGETARAQEEAACGYINSIRSIYNSYTESRDKNRVYAIHLAYRLHTRALKVVLGNELEQPKRIEDILLEDAATPTTRRDIREAAERFDLVEMKDIAMIDGLDTPKLANYSTITNRAERQRGAARWHQKLEGKWHKIATKAKGMAAAARMADREEYRTTLPFTEENLEAWSTDAEGRQYNWAEIRESETVTIWTDGSVTNPTGPDKEGGYAAIVMSGSTKVAVATGRYIGPHCHSDMLEAMAMAHAIVCAPNNIAIKIMTDSMTSVAWWKQYVKEAEPWSRAKRRTTPTYKIWELIADRVARREGNTEIEWTRAHVGTLGNEMADKEAKATAVTTSQVPKWTLNTVPGKVHQYDLLASGLNTLLPPRQVIKKQSKARHSRSLKHHIAKHHPSLKTRLEKEMRVVAQRDRGEDERSLRRAQHKREFALKLATGQLPTLARQHQWSKERYTTDICCRCTKGERENWGHIVDCDVNEWEEGRDAKFEIFQEGMRIISKINRERAEKSIHPKLVKVAETAHRATPLRPLHDVGYLLGWPSEELQSDMVQKGLTKEERRRIVQAMSAKALEIVWRGIWIPRCKQVKRIIGTWNSIQQTLAHTPARQTGPRRRQYGDQPHTGNTHSIKSEPFSWDSINKVVFRTEYYLPMVAPSWCL
jgi:ribonuclease HI